MHTVGWYVSYALLNTYTDMQYTCMYTTSICITDMFAVNFILIVPLVCELVANTETLFCINTILKFLANLFVTQFAPIANGPEQ